MADSRLRKSMIHSAPSASLKDAAKGFFKANPPRRVAEDENGDETLLVDFDLKSDSVSANEDNGETQVGQAGENDVEQLSAGAQNDEPPAKKRRRRKRRILLTDATIKAKKRTEKKPQKDSNDVGENAKKVGAESPTKKEKEPSPEPVKEKPTLDKFTPTQLLYDHILRKLILKDPEEFFATPVQPSMAPDYLTIIEHPMDFMTIRERIESNEYSTINMFRRDVNLIWENAMTYNQPNTIYYVAAQKLSTLAKYYLSKPYLEYLRYSLPFGKQLTSEVLNGREEAASTGDRARRTTVPRSAAGHLERLVSDNMRADDIIRLAETNLKSRLTSRVPACGVGYLDNRDGALALNVLVNAGGVDDCAEADRRRLTLANVVQPLESGNPGLLGFVEPRLCHDYAVTYTEPGPYASFAPQFDSTWSTLNKYDSDVLTACYGDRANAADALTLRQIVAGGCRSDDADGEFLRHVDSLLDSLTDGEHSLALKALEGADHPTSLQQFESKPIARSTMLKMLENIKSLQNLGLDLAYINDLKSEMGLVEAEPKPHAQLNDTGVMIADLAAMNYGRLGAQPPIVLSDAPAPSPAEVQLAQRITGQLSAEIQHLDVKPADVVSAQAVHKSVGLSGADDDDYDYDLLREFMCVDDLVIDAK